MEEYRIRGVLKGRIVVDTKREKTIFSGRAYANYLFCADTAENLVRRFYVSRCWSPAPFCRQCRPVCGGEALFRTAISIFRPVRWSSCCFQSAMLEARIARSSYEPR